MPTVRARSVALDFEQGVGDGGSSVGAADRERQLAADSDHVRRGRYRAVDVAGGRAGLEVSWQVTGTRKDPWAEANRPAVEQDKPAAEQGTYLHPESYGQPEETGIEWVRNPKMMKKVQESRQAVNQEPR